MRVEELELLNFCQHGHRLVQFTPGLTGVIGTNGSGKSNFLGSVRYALTGDVPNYGKKEANINQLAPVSENAFVRLRFSHAGTVATVTRWLRPERQDVLELPGEELIYGDTKITPRILQLLGLDKLMINTVVLVPQDEIFGFLDQTPGKRQDAFQRLYRLDKAAVIYKVTNAHQSTLDIPSVAVSLDELQRRLATLTEMQAVLLQQSAELPGRESLEMTIKAHEETVRRRCRTVQLQQFIASVDDGITQRREERSVLLGHMRDADEDLTTLQAAVVDGEAASQQARSLLLNLEHYREVEKQRNVMRGDLDRARGQLESITDPEYPAELTNFDITAATQQKETAWTNICRLDEFVNSFSGGATACPTCGTSTTVLQERLAAAPAQLAAARQQLKALRERINKYDAWTSAHGSNKVRRQNVQEIVVNAERALQGLDNIKAPEADAAALNNTVVEHQQFVDAVAAVTKVRNDHQQRLARIEGELGSMEQNRGTLLREHATVLVSDEQVQQATAGITAMTAMLSRRRDLDVQILVNQTAITEVQQSIAAAQAVQAQAELMRDWQGFACRVRDLFHRDAAPRVVTQRNLQRQEASINRYLEQFSADFRVTASDGFSFVGHFLDGRQQPAERFSGGEKVIMALAFRLVLNFGYVADLGFVGLDEPTAFLDARHIAGFEPVLRELSAMAATRGLQCIIVTHERALAPLFDTVIQL